jgi:hypothetical protein
VLRAGSGGARLPNKAWDLYLDELDPARGTVHQSTALPCSLGVTDATSPASRNSWAFDKEGFPSLAGNGRLVTVPCYAIPTDGDMTTLAPKLIALLDWSGSLTMVRAAAERSAAGAVVVGGECVRPMLPAHTGPAGWVVR